MVFIFPDTEPDVAPTQFPHVDPSVPCRCRDVSFRELKITVDSAPVMYSIAVVSVVDMVT